MYDMGANTPKSELDQAYRDMVTAWLESVMARHELNLTTLGKALGKDRASASRYLSGKVRAPLQALGRLYHTIKEPLPMTIEAAFYASELGAEAPIQKRA